MLAGTGAIAALAGCGGSGDGATPTATPQSTPTTTGHPESLALEHLRLCTERPTGYREYTAQPEQTYDPGDVVWVYFEPTTTATEPAGEGELRFEYAFVISVTGPEGEELGTVEDTAGKTVPEGADLSTIFLSASFSPPTEFEAGAHTLTVDVTDTIADTTATATAEFEVESPIESTAGDFGFGEFAFTESEARGYRDYDERSPPEFGPTETVWYYYEIQGFAYEETENALSHELSITETLTGPEGEIWSQADIPLSNRFDPETDLDTYYVADRVSPETEWLPGEYELHFDIEDGLAAATTTETRTFTVAE